MTTKTATASKREKKAADAPRKVKTVLNSKKAPAKSKASVGSKNAKTEDITQRIANKAYELYERRGCQKGYDLYDWSVAEEIVALEMAKSSKAKKKKIVPQEDIIRKTERKAYELFERKGYAHGCDFNDWEVARQIVELENA